MSKEPAGIWVRVSSGGQDEANQVPDVPATVPDMPEPEPEPIFSFPVTIARYEGKCPACADPIALGEMITSGEGNSGRWRHARCAQG